VASSCARLRAILRRSGAGSVDKPLHFGRLEIDRGAHAVRVDGQARELVAERQVVGMLRAPALQIDGRVDLEPGDQHGVARGRAAQVGIEFGEVGRGVDEWVPFGVVNVRRTVDSRRKVTRARIGSHS